MDGWIDGWIEQVSDALFHDPATLGVLRSASDYPRRFDPDLWARVHVLLQIILITEI